MRSAWWRLVAAAAATTTLLMLPLASAGGGGSGSFSFGTGSSFGDSFSDSFGSSSSSKGGSPPPAADADGKYWIYGDGIAAAFVPYGASISNLVLRDRRGAERDVVAGFDNATYYSVDRSHPHLGGVPGRYANRIRNSTFSIDGRRYRVLANENPTAAEPAGVDTLHGGPDGWDWRNFTVVAHDRRSVTFALVDPAGKEGFPGEVVAYVSYALAGRDWDISMVARARTAKTPIMLSSHTYWNLDGFASDASSLVLNHTMHMPYGFRRIGVDSILVPTGEILPNRQRSVNDFWSAPRQIGAAWADPELEGNCGAGCIGYDNCFTVDRDRGKEDFDWLATGPVATLSSAWSGIQLDVFTNQDAFQMYSCNGQNGSLALKRTQGTKAFPRTIPKYGCVVLEVQDYIDGINHPEWGRKQIYGPDDSPYVLQAKYRFSLQPEHARGGYGQPPPS